MKRLSDLRRMRDASLAKYRLDLENKVAMLMNELSVVKREIRSRNKRKRMRKACGKSVVGGGPLPISTALPQNRTLQ